MTAAEAVLDLLERSGLSKKALCEAARVSRSSLDAYLKGDRQPSMAQLERLGAAAGLRIDIAWQPVAVELDLRETPRWARAHPSMDPPPLTIEERARVLELVCGTVMLTPARERGELGFPPFRTLTSR